MCIRLTILLLLFPYILMGQEQGGSMSEFQKIDSLISSVEGLKGAKFVRNGKQYDSQDAANHLRRKLRYAGSNIKTAKDFIDKLGTASSKSGKPYQIVYSNGQVLACKAFLEKKLQALEEEPTK